MWIPHLSMLKAHTAIHPYRMCGVTAEMKAYLAANAALSVRRELILY